MDKKTTPIPAFLFILSCFKIIRFKNIVKLKVLCPGSLVAKIHPCHG